MPTTLPSDPLARHKHADEAATVDALLAANQLSEPDRAVILRKAEHIVTASRERRDERGTLDAFLGEFGLSNAEGITLMCLAESLLRTPDADTQDALIAERISVGNWREHLGHSDKAFVNAGVWALMLTGRLVEVEESAQRDPGEWLGRLVSRASEPVIRKAINQAMRIMGGQFVFGRSIDEALARCARQSAGERLYSFDMLGEGARTDAAAQRYGQSYAAAIDAVGAAARGLPNDPRQRSSVSIKLSALHPRYEQVQEARALAELLPRITTLARRAAGHGIQLTIDAEEADRLALSLQLFEQLCQDPALAGWNGLGLALQAYQKRALPAVGWLAELARRSGRKIPVRLVKGAYWDTEIKHAQVMGYADFPVFSRKAATDVSYLVCAQALFAHSDQLYPQFATHNAHSIAAIHQMAGKRPYEFQRLHGMGDLLYAAARDTVLGDLIPLRTYAPVGAHRDLLPYLVRRLLENGANSSFVNRFLDAKVPVAEVIEDPFAVVAARPQRRGRGIALPSEIYAPERHNSRGVDLSDPATLDALREHFSRQRQQAAEGSCRINGAPRGGAAQAVSSPVDRARMVGQLRPARAEDGIAAMQAAHAAWPDWNARSGAERAGILEAMGDALEVAMPQLLYLLSAEAGRTLADGIAEVREAVDFCRYYAGEARRMFTQPQALPGPTGERNLLSWSGRGVFVCISPWNFPLAIFTGQIAAALAAGNTVVAKPAEQTGLIASYAWQLFTQAGLPAAALQLLHGTGADVAAPLLADPQLAGVAFTGSTATARRINQALAARDGAILPLIAETGGLNAMVVDSTALLEQVCDDVMASAFGSAGQRCSALRLLLVQDAIADELLAMLGGALAERRLGDPADPATDIGPIIDETALARLQTHADRMQREARPVATGKLPADFANGCFFAPRIYEIDAISRIGGEVFGPILHVLRYRPQQIKTLLAELKATGYGLTFGVHTRIAQRAERLCSLASAGNAYVNRNIVGAVVGSQPFGGSGLSGTGPKAGGPHYLSRFAQEHCVTTNTTAVGGNAELFRL